MNVTLKQHQGPSTGISTKKDQERKRAHVNITTESYSSQRIRTWFFNNSKEIKTWLIITDFYKQLANLDVGTIGMVALATLSTS